MSAVLNSICPLTARLTHLGVFPDGRPNGSSILISDTDFGFEFQTRKTPAYIPAGGFVDVPLTNRILFSLTEGVLAGLLRSGMVGMNIFFRLRDFLHRGGSLGTGAPLAGINPNIRLQNNHLQVVLSYAESSGMVPGEPVLVEGLSGSYQALGSGPFPLIAVTKGVDLLGPNPLFFLMEMDCPFPDLGATQLMGVVLELPQGKVSVELSSSGDAGGLGSDSVVYVGGSAAILSGLDPTYLQFLPPTGPVPRALCISMGKPKACGGTISKESPLLWGEMWMKPF